MAAEIVALARVTPARLALTGEPVEVLLGGGLSRRADGILLDAIRRGLRDVGEAIAVRVTASPLIVGAALLGLDDLGAGHAAQQRARDELEAAVKRRPARSLSA